MRDWLMRLGWLLPHLGYGRCVRCRRPWWAATERDVWYAPGHGQFALCTGCWDHTSTEERVSAHRQVTARWTSADDIEWTWPAIAATVRRDSAFNPRS